MENTGDPDLPPSIIDPTEPIDQETFLILKQNYAAEDTSNSNEVLDLEKIKHDYETKQVGHELFSKWDTNGDGILDEHELNELHHQFRTTDSNLRYASISTTSVYFFLFLFFCFAQWLVTAATAAWLLSLRVPCATRPT
jgi:hypothetical protein